MRYLLLVPVLAAAGFLSSWLVTLPDVAYLAAVNPNTTVLIEARQAEAAAKGRPIALSWTWVPLVRISPHLQKAVIVSEDASFYQHHGFDWEGLLEALMRSEEHTSELQSRLHLVCRLLLEKKKKQLNSILSLLHE